MALAVGRAHGKRGIDQAQHETQPVVIPARQIIVLSPHKRIRSAAAPRHDRQDQHRDQQPAHAEVEGDRVDQREVAVRKDHDGTAQPVDELECDEHLPRIPFDLGICELVQCDQLVPERRRDGRCRQEPAAEVQEAGKPANYAAVPGSCSYAGPVVNTPRRRNRRNQLSERRRYESVEYRNQDSRVPKQNKKKVNAPYISKNKNKNNKNKNSGAGFSYNPYNTAMGPPLKIATTIVPPVRLHALSRSITYQRVARSAQSQKERNMQRRKRSHSLRDDDS